MKLNFDIYLSGRVQKLHGLKPANLQKEAEITLHSDWWSVWRCEHLASDKKGTHLFVFTNATSYYSLIVHRDSLEIQGLLLKFQKQWLNHLESICLTLPRKLEVHTRIIKGNPSKLTGVMNNIIWHSNNLLFKRKVGYDFTEDFLSTMLVDGPNYIVPKLKLEELLREHPLED